MPSIVWFRQDLRTSDNPALTAASKRGEVIPLFIIDTTDRPLGSASKWWLHHSLTALRKDLGGLIVRNGNPEDILRSLLEQSGADAVFWNRCYQPHSVKRDKAIKAGLKQDGVHAESFPGSVLHEPWETATGSGGPYKVYSPFWRAIKAKGTPAPLPQTSCVVSNFCANDDGLEALDLKPVSPNWASQWLDHWCPGEAGAQAQAQTFLAQGIRGYGDLRNRPDLPNVSRLSPHIHFGEISPRQLFAISAHHAAEHPEITGDVDKFQSEIAWRDFANHLLFHFPDIPQQNWKPAFDHYPWRESADDLKAWQKGMTGYPMVDAGMRELWNTGYMHNRVRMLVASFLVKHLRIHWKEGEKWFWDTLVDADLANNVASWQWVTGSGADAAPYFRIFSPLSQGPKFDPNGDYVRQWCPELANLPNDCIHTPFQASPETLAKAGVVLGETYPSPIVDHKVAREAALAGYEIIKQQTATTG